MYYNISAGKSQHPFDPHRPPTRNHRFHRTGVHTVRQAPRARKFGAKIFVLRHAGVHTVRQVSKEGLRASRFGAEIADREVQAYTRTSSAESDLPLLRARKFGAEIVEHDLKAYTPYVKYRRRSPSC